MHWSPMSLLEFLGCVVGVAALVCGVYMGGVWKRWR